MSKSLKILIITACAVLVCAGATVTTLIMVSNHRTHQLQLQQQQYIDDILASITENERLFNSSDDKAYRVTIHDNLLTLQVEFLNSGYESDEVTFQFISVIDHMEDRFFTYYSDEIEKAANGDNRGSDDLIVVYSGKIDGLNYVKSMVETDGIFNGSSTRKYQLNEKVNEYTTYFAKVNDWLIITSNINDRFYLAERTAKLDIYTEILEVILEYEENSFKNEDVTKKLEELKNSTSFWFFLWYEKMIGELSAYNIEEPYEEEDDEDIDLAEEECEDECDEDCDGDCKDVELYDYLLNAIIELNNLVDLFDFEHEIVFNPAAITYFIRSFDEALFGNLTALEDIGVKIINNRNYQDESKENAIEKYNELFEEWIKLHKDNDHIPTYSDLLKESLALAKEIEDRLEQERLAREAAARARRNTSNNQNSGSTNPDGTKTITVTGTGNCNKCGALFSASRTITYTNWYEWRATGEHDCDTGEWVDIIWRINVG